MSLHEKQSDVEKAEAAQTEHFSGESHSADRQSDASLVARDANIVQFDASDKADPHNWPQWKRYGVVVFASWLNVMVCLGASGYSTGGAGIMEDFDVSSEVVTAGLSLYVVRLPMFDQRS